MSTVADKLKAHRDATSAQKFKVVKRVLKEEEYKKDVDKRELLASRVPFWNFLDLDQ